jgi:hypothetical protein
MDEMPLYRGYRNTSLIAKCHHVGPYSRTIHRLLWRSYGEGAVSFERGTPVHEPKAFTASAEALYDECTGSNAHSKEEM